jgi:hypothetical protein
MTDVGTSSLVLEECGAHSLMNISVISCRMSLNHG